MLKIAEIRKEKGLTQKQLAEKLKIYQSNMSNWENGITEPDIQSLIKIADILDVHIDELVGRELVDFKNEVEKRKELRPSNLKLVEACSVLNDMGVASLMGYLTRMIEEHPEYLVPSARRQ